MIGNQAGYVIKPINLPPVEPI